MQKSVAKDGITVARVLPRRGISGNSDGNSEIKSVAIGKQYKQMTCEVLATVETVIYLIEIFLRLGSLHTCIPA